MDKSDIVWLSICGANCLSTLEYFSEYKLRVTTKPWKPGTGKIVIETQSGGKSQSLVDFTFVDDRSRVNERSEVTEKSGVTEKSEVTDRSRIGQSSEVIESKTEQVKEVSMLVQEGTTSKEVKSNDTTSK